jgi:hypothetical protein
MTSALVASRLARILGVALLGSIGIALLSLVPDLYRLLPSRVRGYWPEELALALISAYGLARWLARTGLRAGTLARRARDWLARIDSIDEPALWRGLATVVGLVCSGFLVTWIPHYLTWPWSRDEDTFAVLAQSWDRGILPYGENGDGRNIDNCQSRPVPRIGGLLRPSGPTDSTRNGSGRTDGLSSLTILTARSAATTLPQWSVSPDFIGTLNWSGRSATTRLSHSGE